MMSLIVVKKGLVCQGESVVQYCVSVPSQSEGNIHGSTYRKVPCLASGAIVYLNGNNS